MQEAYEQKKKEDLDAAKKAAYDEVSTPRTRIHTYTHIDLSLFVSFVVCSLEDMTILRFTATTSLLVHNAEDIKRMPTSYLPCSARI